MTVAKSDVLRKRLLSAGLSAEACAKYIETLRAFLNARMTKSRYEDEMAKVLPKDKIHVHNSIIQDILFRAQQKRDGLRDLPVIKRPLSRRPAPPRIANGQTTVEKKLKVGQKRPHEDIDSDQRKQTPADEPITQGSPKKPKTKPQPPKKLPETDKPIPSKPKLPGLEKASPKLPAKRQKPESAPSTPHANNGTPPASSRMQPPKTQAQAHCVEIPTYEKLHFFPVRPGHNVDLDLFRKLRHRMRRIAVEELGMSGIKDDAVTLLLRGLELHVKSMMENGARQRAGRDGVRPHRNLQCGPVRGYDFREASRANPILLGDESGMELERLLMLF